MCSVGLAVGGISAVGGIMQAQGQHNAQKAAVARQNQIAHQQYQDQLRQTQERDRIAKEKHASDLEAHAQAIGDFNKQVELNQLETNRALTIANRKKKEKQTEVAFAMQEAVGKSIEAQGQLLSTGNTGQSFLLQTQENQRQLGFATAQLEQTLYDASAAHHLEKGGIITQQYSKNAAAYSNLPGFPQPRRASFLPYKPIKAQGPSKMALMGAMIGAVGGGIGAGIGAEADWKTYKG
tara:strand:- start:2657 stop:3367 length:711 start_codon:yes stop_codon:yes gene_type:complete